MSEQLRVLLLRGLLILPWLVPPPGGPSPVVTAWLATLVCLALLLMLVPKDAPAWAGRVVPQAWLAAALISASFGLLQYFGLDTQLPFVTASPAGEAYANLRQRNQLATLTAIGLLALFTLLKRDNRQAPGRQSLAVLMALLLAAGAAATASRTGLLHWVLVLCLMLAWGGWRLPQLRRLAWVAAIAYLGAAWLLPELGGKSSGQDLYARLQETGLSCSSRLALWRNVLHLIVLKPWTGWGWGELDYAHVMTLFPGVRFCALLDNAHNLPLHLAVELGVPLAVVACVGVLWGVLRAAPWREHEPVRQLAWAVIAVIAVHSLLEYPLWYGPFQLGLLLCVLLLRQKSMQMQGAAPTAGCVPNPEPQPVAMLDGVALAARGTALRHGLGAALLVLASYVAWDYHRISQLYLQPQNRSAWYRDDPMRHARASCLFQPQVQFAWYTLTPLGPDNAAELYAAGWALMHFSPEARVIEKLIQASVLLGHDEQTQALLQRYRAAYPEDYARWSNQPAR